MTDGAVDVGCFSAGATDHVVVVVADTILIPGWRTRGLDAPDKTLLGHDFEGVVDRSAAKMKQPISSANVLGDLIRAMQWGPTRHRLQHGQALSRNLEAVASLREGLWLDRHA